MDERTLARFLSKINQHGPVPVRRPDLGPCWLWKPSGSVGGYGQFLLKGKMKLAHRVSYEHFTAPIPPKLTIDHLCCVRSCVRPSHLEAVTLAENLRRARAWADYRDPGSWNREKTHCPQEHPYSGANLYVRASGKRVCRACARELMAARRARARELTPLQPRKLKETCANSHSMAETAVTYGGKHFCGQCMRDRVRAYRERKRTERGLTLSQIGCKHGHPWTEESTYITRAGHKACRTCHNERSLARYYERKAQRFDAPELTLF